MTNFNKSQATSTSPNHGVKKTTLCQHKEPAIPQAPIILFLLYLIFPNRNAHASVHHAPSLQTIRKPSLDTLGNRLLLQANKRYLIKLV